MTATVAFHIMPINRRYPVAQVLEAARDFIQHTNRKVMLEYVMLPYLSKGSPIPIKTILDIFI